MKYNSVVQKLFDQCLDFHLIRWRFYMFKNYLKIAFRNLKMEKGYSIINIASISIGLACCILLYFFVEDEKTYDQFHKNIDRIYYIQGNVDFERFQIGVSPEPAMSVRMTDEFPEVENAVRVKKEELLIKTDGDAVKMIGFSTDPSFLNIFSFPLATGEIKSALHDISSIVLTEKTSRILFGSKNPVSETVSLNINDTYVDFIVTGVTKPIPNNSSLKFDFLINIRGLRADELKNSQSSVPTFLLLSDKNNYNQLIGKFPQSIDKDLSEKYKGKGAYNLYPLKGYHLSEDNNSIILSGQGDITYIYILSGIALIILLTACFNYTNLSIGRFSSRMKEVGMRKVMGAQMRQISRQFMFESVFLSVVSLIPAVILSLILLPSFNLLVGKELTINVIEYWQFILFLFILIIFVSIIAGLYPSIVAARSTSLDLFKGRIKLSGKNIFSKALIIFQFGASIFLIIGTMFLGKQINFMLSCDLGYDSEKVVRISLENISKDNQKNQSFFFNFKAKLGRYSSIKNVCGAKYSLTSSWMLWAGETKENESRFMFNQNYVDHDYIETLGIQMLQGRNFSQEFPTDFANSVIVNEEFVREMKLAEPVGINFNELFKEPQYLVCGSSKIIGVVKDFNNESLSKKILPIALILNNNESFDYLYVKFAGSIQENIQILKKEFRELAPQFPFDLTFLDEQVALQYQKEEKWSRIISWSSFFAVGIACSGLFGLTLLIIKKRTKEIGIRKVLGASVPAIMRLINKEFLWMIIFANIIAWPAVYYSTNMFLQDYAYRISIDIWTFITAGILSFAIAVLTTSIHGIKASIQNPVNTIKYE